MRCARCCRFKYGLRNRRIETSQEVSIFLIRHMGRAGADTVSFILPNRSELPPLEETRYNGRKGKEGMVMILGSISNVCSLLLAAAMASGLAGCGAVPPGAPETPGAEAPAGRESPAEEQLSVSGAQPADSEGPQVTAGTELYRGFRLDNVLHSEEGDIHYHLDLPDSYDGSEPYALYLTLPGYEGLYFQGVGQNLYQEEFAFEARNYRDHMIVAAPQLSDWGETSARQTIALTEYLLDAYNIDEEQVYASGYSGGGETISQVLSLRPDLFTAYLHCSSQWDGTYEPVAESRTPVYLVVGEDDEYYGARSTREAYEQLYGLYRAQGLSEEEIDRLLVLDVKDAAYFQQRGASSQHGGGALFAHDPDIMGWLFQER